MEREIYKVTYETGPTFLKQDGKYYMEVTAVAMSKQLYAAKPPYTIQRFVLEGETVKVE